MTTNSYITAGIKVNVREVGGNWIQSGGYVEQTPVNKYVYAGGDIPAGDFTIQATLILMQLNQTDASFDLAGNRFGFDGEGNRFFTEGIDWGARQYHGQASNYITPGQSFNLVVARTGSDISFKINGTTIVTMTLNGGTLIDVGFRPWLNTIRIFDFSSTTQIAYYVLLGIKESVIEQGGAWIQGSGYIEQTGMGKFLYAGENIPVGDFVLQSRISLSQLNATAASFDLAGNRFGFDGFGNAFFTEGVDWGSTQFHGPASAYITAGTPFTLQVTRTGSDISFKINNGTPIVTRTLNSGSLANVGFRPWRNTMRVFDFYREGGQVSTQFFSDTIVFTHGTSGYHTFRIPAIVRAGNGNLLAFAEGRVSSGDDFGNVDIVMRRSTNNGLSWEPLAPVVDNGGLQAGNPGAVVDDTNKIILVYNTGTAKESDIIAGIGVREVWVTTSTDHGHTWSLPVNITTSVHKPKQPGHNPAYNFPEDWRWHAVVPGHAIQLSNGRLIFGANFRLADGDAQSFTFYSDDRGSTWHIGGIAGKPGNESTLVQLANGNVMMNSRRFPPINPPNLRYRQVSISTNNGINFSSFQDDTELPEPSCQASLIRFTTNPTSRILFSNPADQSSRINLTVKVSYDEGGTWTRSRIVNSSGAYSDLVIEADNKTIGLLYESNGIRYARFNIEWLTNGQDSIA